MRVRPGDVTLRNCVDDDRWDYRVRCPLCGLLAVEPSDRWLALEAFGAGAGLERWHLPSELEEPHTGPPISLRDVFDLVLALSEAEWMNELEPNHDPNGRRNLT